MMEDENGKRAQLENRHKTKSHNGSGDCAGGENQDLLCGPGGITACIEACYIALLDRAADETGIKARSEGFVSLYDLVTDLCQSSEFKQKWNLGDVSIAGEDLNLTRKLSILGLLIVSAVGRAERTHRYDQNCVAEAASSFRSEIARVEASHRQIKEELIELGAIIKDLDIAGRAPMDTISDRLMKEQLAINQRLASIEKALQQDRSSS